MSYAVLCAVLGLLLGFANMALGFLGMSIGEYRTRKKYGKHEDKQSLYWCLKTEKDKLTQSFQAGDYSGAIGLGFFAFLGAPFLLLATFGPVNQPRPEIKSNFWKKK